LWLLELSQQLFEVLFFLSELDLLVVVHLVVVFDALRGEGPSKRVEHFEYWTRRSRVRFRVYIWIHLCRVIYLGGRRKGPLLVWG
jgi:hypothetical protein